jgi:hypothetical protein
MSRPAPALPLALALAGGLCLLPCPAQQPPPYPAPVAVEGGPPALPPAPPPAGPEPPPDPAAWFVNAELGVLRPSVRFEPAIGGRADLAWALSPRVELGYVFGEGGAIRLAYRNLSSHGVSQAPLDLPVPVQGAETDTTTLDAHWIDVDYVSRVYAPTERGRIQWEVGPRVVGRFLKLRADAPVGELTNPTSFWGVGPYAGADLWYLCGDSGLALFSHLDAAATFGTDHAHVTGSLVVPLPGGGQFAMPVHESAHRSEAEVDLNAEVGLGWCRSFSASWLRLKAGVQVEGWGLGGKSNPDFFPYKSVGTAGPFVRCELGF